MNGEENIGEQLEVITRLDPEVALTRQQEAVDFCENKCGMREELIKVGLVCSYAVIYLAARPDLDTEGILNETSFSTAELNLSPCSKRVDAGDDPVIVLDKRVQTKES